MKLNFSKKFFQILVVLIALTLSYFFYLQKQLSLRQVKNKEVVNITIKKGMSWWEICQTFNQKKIINQYQLAFYLWKNHLTNKIIANQYQISPQINLAELAYLITHDKKKNNQSLKITFPEGWSTQQMAEKLKKNNLDYVNFLELSQNSSFFYKKYHYSFLKDVPTKNTLEGFLFPDTYFFSNQISGEEIIKKMLDNFDRKLDNQMRVDIKKQKKSIYQVIIMASLLEKEVRSFEDKKRVSDIFWRRVQDQYPLQSCATLAYILKKNKKQFSYADTQINSPFNTYKNIGLPPAPIDNPGKDAILAAIYPEKNSYYFFLNNPETGETVFSRTLQEHNLNKKKNGL